MAINFNDNLKQFKTMTLYFNKEIKKPYNEFFFHNLRMQLCHH